MKLDNIDTENINPNTLNIDRASTAEILRMINNEDKLVAYAVEKELPNIEKAVDIIYEQLKKGGRLIYIGAGTSGRLGILDTVECPPTFGTDTEMVQGIIAGGDGALIKAVEGAEDNAEMGAEDIKSRNFSPQDVLVGIAASGRTPYVIGAMQYAKSIGAKVIAVSCSSNSRMAEIADVAITPLVGPEVIAGSTRMKSGTAQKMVLNMLSSATMIKLGKTYTNLMVDVHATNKKLERRAVKIVTSTTGTNEEEAQNVLSSCGGNCKMAIACIKCNLSPDEAKKALHNADGHLRKIIE
ncbi:MAG: N-acetylmuramic acid 6-phosphate etherase [Christensenellaceae bacterium]|nr:N-acetylmuramic acid 6-phosphate etherase [Christensenellaceae bacterium]